MFPEFKEHLVMGFVVVAVALTLVGDYVQGFKGGLLVGDLNHTGAKELCRRKLVISVTPVGGSTDIWDALVRVDSNPLHVKTYTTLQFGIELSNAL